ncbi:MAG: hypothetical protein J6K16_01220 [Alphaproteobacteria bacterium]|nr:hypothetical protein [Alphaproteobacteria bacterium]
MVKNKKQKGGFRKKLLTFATLLSTIIPSNSFAKEAVQKDDGDSTEKVVTVVPTRKIDYQVDTVNSITNYGSYSRSKNTITLYYQKLARHYDLPEEFIAMSVIHEQKHRDNKKMRISEYPVSPEQAYKLDMHNEISANLAELIYVRDRYIKTGDTKILGITSRFKFYKDAIEQGIINPKSKYKEDFDKEMSLIVNGVIKMWDNTIAGEYTAQNAGNAFNNSNHSGSYAEFYDENYQKCVQMTYNVGGVDFSQYIKNDVEIPEVGKKRLDYMLMQSYFYVRGHNNQKICERFNLPEYNGNLTINEYRNLLRHALVIQNMSFLEEAPEEHINKIALSYVKKEKNKEEIAAEYEKSFKVVDEYFHSTVDGIIDRLVTDSHSGNIKIPKRTKNKGSYYEQALRELYTAHIEKDGTKLDINLSDILNPEGKMPLNDMYKISAGVIIEEKNNKKISVAELSKPQYRRWKNKDGERVSKVQYFEAIDTSKDIIVQPETSYMAEVEKNIKDIVKNPIENLMALKNGKEY